MRGWGLVRQRFQSIDPECQNNPTSESFYRVGSFAAGSVTIHPQAFDLLGFLLTGFLLIGFELGLMGPIQSDALCCNRVHYSLGCQYRSGRVARELCCGAIARPVLTSRIVIRLTFLES